MVASSCCVRVLQATQAFRCALDEGLMATIWHICFTFSAVLRALLIPDAGAAKFLRAAYM